MGGVVTVTVGCGECGCDRPDGGRCPVCGDRGSSRYTAVPEADLSNALVGQKNAVLTAVVNAEDGKDLAAAEATFRLLADVWHAVGYGYKAREVRRRIADRANFLLRDAEAELAGMRKNDRHRGHRETNAARLTELAAL